MEICALGALEVEQRIRAGELSSEQCVDACARRIEATDDRIRAWAHFDRGRALDEARAMDELRRHGQPLGLLHGVPVGVKDIFDTRGVPTALGTEVHRGRVPDADAAVVEKLREAGAVMLGKTATTEYAFMHPAATRNPHDPTRTPGGSSSGSAAAVAAAHVPIAIGSQTNGSVIRPAAYCGVYGFKPSRGIISRRGMLRTSRHLDQVGVFARELRDAAMLADVLAGYDAADPASYLRPRPRMLQGCMSEVPVEPSFAWLDLPNLDRLSADAREGFEELLDALGERVERLPAPRSFADALRSHTVVHEVELYRNLREDIERHGEHLSEEVRAAAERGQDHGEASYAAALAMLEGAERYFGEFFCDYDAIITPASGGEAPDAGSGTGDPSFCTLWTFAGLPCLSLPLLIGGAGLPVGVQLVGAANADDRLLRTARWLLRELQQQEESGDE
jgi:Asp-tRNA(Asn)/Glu-tRNA(Gln) amidotransferase A subunit family amidase